MLESFLRDIKSQVIADTKSFIDPTSNVAKSMLYTATAESKCFRAALVHATAIGLNIKNNSAVRELATCIEMLHSYSLIHDDLPCMDDDDLRRGKPANHIQFGEATAVLAGDALQLRALQIIVESPNIKIDTKLTMLSELLDACGYQGMILGQELDMLAGKDPSINVEEIHSLKTAKLIRSAICCAAMLEIQDITSMKLNELGEHIGMAFQITDDVLEHTETSDTLGKNNLSDAKNQKQTYVTKFGMNAAMHSAQTHINDAQKLIQTSFQNPEYMTELANMVVKRKS